MMMMMMRVNHARLQNELPANVKVLTYFSNTCTALCWCGLTVASNRGRKMFSRILAKCGINFFDLKMSLHNQITTISVVQSRVMLSLLAFSQQFTLEINIENHLHVVVFKGSRALTRSWGSGSSTSCWVSGPCAE